MKLKDFLKLFEGKNPEMEIVTPDQYGNFEKDISLISLFVAADDFESRSFSAYTGARIDYAIKNGKDPIEVLRIW